MKIIDTPLQGSAIIETTPFTDHRGIFARFFCQNELSSLLKGKSIVNVNFSQTVKKGMIRGMHFQHSPGTEIKMVRAIKGSVFDVIVDLRKESPTFLQWYGEVLSADNKKMMFVPEGFAHGFQALEDDSEIMYLVTEFYSPENEAGIRYDDPAINIEWPLPMTDISGKDLQHKLIGPSFEGITL